MAGSSGWYDTVRMVWMGSEDMTMNQKADKMNEGIDIRQRAQSPRYAQMTHVQWSPSTLGNSCPSHLVQEILKESESIIGWNILAEVLFSKKAAQGNCLRSQRGWDVAYQSAYQVCPRPEINMQHYNKQAETQRAEAKWVVLGIQMLEEQIQRGLRLAPVGSFKERTYFRRIKCFRSTEYFKKCCSVILYCFEELICPSLP